MNENQGEPESGDKVWVGVDIGGTKTAIVLSSEPPAILARVGISDAKQLKIFFPVRALFGERGGAKTNFNPGHCVIARDARVLHVPEIFIAGDRALAQCLFIDRSG